MTRSPFRKSYLDLLPAYKPYAFEFFLARPYQAEVVCQFTANSPAANSTGWSCLPIRFKREILTFFIRTSKRTVTFALNKVFQTRSAFLNDEYLLRDIAIVGYLILVSCNVCYGITFNPAYYLSLLQFCYNLYRMFSSSQCPLHPSQHV